MTYTYHWECPACGAEIACEVDTREHEVDAPVACDECGHAVTESELARIYRDGEAAAIAAAQDEARDRDR